MAVRQLSGAGATFAGSPLDPALGAGAPAHVAALLPRASMMTQRFVETMDRAIPNRRLDDLERKRESVMVSVFLTFALSGPPAPKKMSVIPRC